MKRATQATALLGILALAAGCGLGDYERLMVRSQAKVQSFDEANALLGEPVELPKVAGKEGERDAPVFFRPPRSIAKKDDGKPLGGLVHHFGRAPAIPG